MIYHSSLELHRTTSCLQGKLPFPLSDLRSLILAGYQGSFPVERLTSVALHPGGQYPLWCRDRNTILTSIQAAPIALTINNTRADIPNIMITNSGSQRFDVLAGPFTKNDQFTASPFSDSFLFIENVTFSLANQVLPALNKQGAEEKRALLEGREADLYKKGYVDKRYIEWLREMAEREGAFVRRAAKNLTLGYVTSDVRFTSHYLPVSSLIRFHYY